MNKIKAAIIGASGYTGIELIRILLNHKYVEIKALVANSNAGSNIDSLYSHLNHVNLPVLCKIEDLDFSKLDVIFGCLPHTKSQEFFSKILKENKNPNLKLIDLSADFRLDDPKNYEKWYKYEHIAVEIQSKAVYGLTEINREKIKNAELVACPGCYPTSALLPLIPLLNESLISAKNIIIDSHSGTSGAGRALKETSLFCEVNNSVKAYGIGSHRHISEIEQELTKAANQNLEIEFTPHLLPINRGIISTIYVDLNENVTVEKLEKCLKEKYKNDHFVKICDHEISISDVISTNNCFISVNKARSAGKAIIISVIDNLCKGASGQAVQNMNLLFKMAESEGLIFNPIYP